MMSVRFLWAPSRRSCTPRLTVDDDEDQSDDDSEDHDLRRSKRAEARHRSRASRRFQPGDFTDRDHDVQTVRLTSL